MNQKALKYNFGLDSFMLKVIAVVTMVVDHTGVIFGQYLDNNVYIMLRTIGRVSFPIFAFLLVQGFIHTKNRQQYFTRLLGFGVAIHLVLSLLGLLGFALPLQVNIFITLSIGFLAMWFLDTYREQKIISILMLLALCIFAEMIQTDYGAYGVATVIFFYLTRQYKTFMLGSFALLTVVHVFLQHLLYHYTSSLQLYAIGSLLFISLYNGKKGATTPKYFFYLFYPIHFIVLFMIRFAIFGA